MATAKMPTLPQATVLSLKRNQRSSKSSNLNLKSNQLKKLSKTFIINQKLSEK